MPQACALVELLLTHGANVELSDRAGFTALHWAAAVGTEAAAKAIVQAAKQRTKAAAKAASVDAANPKTGDTPLHRASR